MVRGPLTWVNKVYAGDSRDEKLRKRSPLVTTKTVPVETTAQAYLALLRERGIDYFFANAGTDFAPLVDAFACFTQEGKPIPQPVIVPHENAAMAMAHGYYLVTGKPQVVMVHVNVGTGNAVNGIINACRDHVPLLVTAGRTPITEAGLPGARDLYIHWAQESFDQAAMVREYVKWDYELRNFTQLEVHHDLTATPPPRWGRLSGPAIHRGRSSNPGGGRKPTDHHHHRGTQPGCR
jgi:hypothetical protein